MFVDIGSWFVDETWFGLIYLKLLKALQISPILVSILVLLRKLICDNLCRVTRQKNDL